MRKFLKSAVIAADIIIIVLLAVIIYLEQNMPNNYYVQNGSRLKLSGAIEAVSCSRTEAYATVEKDEAASSRSELKLWGIFPIKTVSVHQVDNPLLVPCGEPFGIKLLTDGVIVVEVSSFHTQSGFCSPAQKGGIRTGDIITTINGISVKTNHDVEEIISQSNGSDLEVNLIRNGENLVSEIYPLKCTSDDTFRAGLWVRDSSAGIGTLTFYNPDTKTFAGLGHPVCDVDTGFPLPLYSGEAVNVCINGIKKGSAGYPGELVGSFSSGFSIGSLTTNASCGLYGKMNNFSPSNQSVPLGFRQDITLGKAYIYSTISGASPKQYEIEIEKIDLSDKNDSKNMVIKITDKRLIDKTGGIVQGMSGSPIIQDGKLIGAVTHVFINNPEKGYAVFADKMYEESLLAAK